MSTQHPRFRALCDPEVAKTLLKNGHLTKFWQDSDQDAVEAQKSFGSLERLEDLLFRTSTVAGPTCGCYCFSPNANFPHRPHSHLPPRKCCMSYREGSQLWPMIQQRTLFSGFISSLPQFKGRHMMAEPGRERKRAHKKPLFQQTRSQGTTGWVRM